LTNEPARPAAKNGFKRRGACWPTGSVDRGPETARLVPRDPPGRGMTPPRASSSALYLGPGRGWPCGPLVGSRGPRTCPSSAATDRLSSHCRGPNVGRDLGHRARANTATPRFRFCARWRWRCGAGGWNLQRGVILHGIGRRLTAGGRFRGGERVRDGRRGFRAVPTSVGPFHRRLDARPTNWPGCGPPVMDPPATRGPGRPDTTGLATEGVADPGGPCPPGRQTCTRAETCGRSAALSGTARGRGTSRHFWADWPRRPDRVAAAIPGSVAADRAVCGLEPGVACGPIRRLAGARPVSRPLRWISPQLRIQSSGPPPSPLLRGGSCCAAAPSSRPGGVRAGGPAGRPACWPGSRPGSGLHPRKRSGALGAAWSGPGRPDPAGRGRWRVRHQQPLNRPEFLPERPTPHHQGPHASRPRKCMSVTLWHILWCTGVTLYAKTPQGNDTGGFPRSTFPGVTGRSATMKTPAPGPSPRDLP